MQECLSILNDFIYLWQQHVENVNNFTIKDVILGYYDITILHFIIVFNWKMFYPFNSHKKSHSRQVQFTVFKKYLKIRFMPNKVTFVQQTKCIFFLQSGSQY